MIVKREVFEVQVQCTVQYYFVLPKLVADCLANNNGCFGALPSSGRMVKAGDCRKLSIPALQEDGKYKSIKKVL